MAEQISKQMEYKYNQSLEDRGNPEKEMRQWKHPELIEV
jgi:hypothetical protein